MKKMAKAVYAIGTETLDDISYGYDYPAGSDHLWKSKLEYAEDAGVETVKARTSEPVYRYDGGRRLISGPFPRLLIKEGPKRVIADFEQTLGVMIVSESFSSFLEALEPSVHQFEPVKINWGDGTHAADMFILVICTALDSIAADHVEGLRSLKDFGYGDGIKRLGPWGDPSGRRALRPNKMIFDLQAIGSHCLWQDEFLVSNPLCSDIFQIRYNEAGLKGATFGQRAAV